MPDNCLGQSEGTNTGHSSHTDTSNILFLHHGMANKIDTEYDPVEGVHNLDSASYREQARSQPALTCENCKKRRGEQGVDMKRCRGVRPAISTWRGPYINFVYLIILVLDRLFLLERCQCQLICSFSV